MRSLIRGEGCRRAREWASLKLDGELSELETRLLAAHVAVCEECREFDHDQTAVAGLLRTTRLEVPERAFSLPTARRRLSARPLHVATAAAAVVAAIAAGTVLRLPGDQRPRAARAQSPAQAIPRRAELALADKIGVPGSSSVTGRPSLARPWRGIPEIDV